MEAPTNGKKLFIATLSVILTVLLSYTIYTKFIKREGFDLFGGIGKVIKSIGKIFKFLFKIDKVFCWMGDVVEWFINTLAATLYYMTNVFTGRCFMFYWFDMIFGMIWYVILAIASVIQLGDVFVSSSKQLGEWCNEIDAYANGLIGMTLFSYSKQTKSKCYKLKIDAFPKWPL